MAKLFTSTVNGFTKSYSVDFYDFISAWNEVSGIYLVAVHNPANNIFTIIYVGETDNLQARFSNHEKKSCFDKYKANILGWINEATKNERLKIEVDLIPGLKPACNEQI